MNFKGYFSLCIERDILYDLKSIIVNREVKVVKVDHCKMHQSSSVVTTLMHKIGVEHYILLGSRRFIFF